MMRRAWKLSLVTILTTALFVTILGSKGLMKEGAAPAVKPSSPIAAAPAVRFCLPNQITIPVAGVLGTATPYPSTISVGGMVGTVSSVSVTLNNLQHFWASDIDILLVSPDGRKFVMMSDVGGDTGFDSPATITLSDAATASLPDANNVAIPTGTYKPTNFGSDDEFPTPAPPAPYNDAAPAGTATFASVFNGANPNGDWKLYVRDDSSGAGGNIAGGWCLDITTSAPLPGQLEFNLPGFNQYANTTASVTVRRVNGNQGAVTVDYATANGTATGGATCGAGVDYINTSGTLSFADGESSKDFTVQLCADSGPETDETIALTLSNPTGGASIGAQGESDLIIIPTLSAPATQFCNPAPVRIAAFSDAGVSSPYPSNINVNGLSGVVTNVKITLNNLQHSFGNDIDILLVSPTGQKFVVVSDISGSQGFTIARTITLTDFAATNLPTTSVPVAPGAYKPTNLNTGDFFPAPAPGTPYQIPEPAGSATFASTFNGFDPNGTWSLYIYDDAGGGSGDLNGGWCLDITTTNPQAAGQLQFGTSNYSINEGETVNVTVARSGGSLGAVTVNYATSNGSAAGGTACGAAGVDFINQSGTLSFPDGVASQTIPIQMCLDAENEANENFNLTLSNPTGGATIGTNGAASVSIRQVDQSILRLYGSNNYAREGTVQSIVLTRNFNQIGSVTIDYQTSNGAATGGAACTPGVDYINTSGTLTFLPGEVMRSFNITTCNDSISEPVESLNITLSNAVGAQISVPSSGVLFIFESDWKKQASFPTGQTLSDVHMISSLEGWAVGSFGVIVHTTDGGITWERQQSGTYEQLNAVHFEDALNGWAHGNIALYTNDGGRTWKQAHNTLPGVGTVYQMTFASLTRGFATGNATRNIMRTTDGGRTWLRQDLPIRAGLVKFFDELNGIISSSEGVLVTKNGGDTWTQQPGATGGSEWFDMNRGWRINNSDFDGTVIRQKIDYTTDGGVTWTQGATPDGTFVSQLFFTDAMNGWGVGTKENIIRTSDGGVTWHTQRGGLTAPTRFNYPLEDIHMSDPLRGITVGHTGQVYTTSDGGATWTARQSGGGYQVHKIVATDARHAWASTYNGDILSTTNGGKFWSRQHIYTGGDPQAALPAGIAFPDRQNGWVSIRGRIGTPSIPSVLRTRNGGRDWEEVNNAPAHNAWAIDTFDNQTIVSVGFDGGGAPIVRSIDGGQTWTYTRFPDSSIIRDVDMVSPNIGYAAAGAQIIKSTDGFATWTRVALSGSWFDVSFVDENNGWALGSNGSGFVELWHTTNGGQTWSMKSMPDAVAVHAVNTQVAWVAEFDYDPLTAEYDAATYALRTIDGGQNFTRELVSLDTLSTGLFFVDADNGWVGGTNEQYPSLISDGADIFRRGTLGLNAGTAFDFDGDGQSDVGVFRQSNATWYLNRSAQGFAGTQFGLASDKIAPADFDGDGKTDIAVFRNGDWHILASSNNQLRTVQFGTSGDVPVAADYDGDGKADTAVFRQGVWYILDSSTNQMRSVQFGLASDKVVPADYDGDGKTDIAVFRAGTWYLLGSQTGFAAVQFGLSTDVPVAGDYDGDAKADVAVFRDGNWYMQQSTGGVRAMQFGQSNDAPVPADYDGDGRTDVAVYRAGVWYILQSQNGFAATQFGLSDDMPLPAPRAP